MPIFNEKGQTLGVVVAIVIAIAALVSVWFSHPGPHGSSVGSSVNGGNVTDFTAVNTDAGYWVNGSTQLLNAGAGGFIANLFLGPSGTGTTTALTKTARVVTFITSSSTIFALQNPTGATTTVTLSNITGVQGATTTDILVATSTTSAPPNPVTATSTLGANIFNLAAISANARFYSTAGVTIGPGTGYTRPATIPNSASVAQFVLGPSEWIIGYSTSTSPTGTGVGQVTVPASGTAKFQFDL